MLTQSARRALGKKLSQWQGDPVGFVREVIGAEPTAQQARILRSVAKGQKNAVAVASGHGIGKSATLAWLIAWFLLTRPPPNKIIATAPSKRQLRDILWSELTHWIRNARIRQIADLLDIQKEVIRVEGREDWFARAISINTEASEEEQAELLAGYHAPHLLCIIDEASGVPDPVFRPIEGYFTGGKDNKVVLTSNPTRSEGYFFKIFNEADFGEDFIRLQLSSEESPLVSKAWIQSMERKYGRDSDTFRVRVLGEFPRRSHRLAFPDALLQRASYDPATLDLGLLEGVPTYVGIDVARFGDDSSVIVVRRGSFITDIVRKNGLDTFEVMEWALEELSKLKVWDALIFVDTTGGLGAGVADALRRYWNRHNVIDVINNARASEPNRFLLLRSELFWRVKTFMELGMLRIPNDAFWLKKELHGLRYEERRGKIYFEEKSKFKKRMGFSPDHADALALTFFFEETDIALSSVAYKPRIKRGGKWYGYGEPRSWKTV